MLFAMRSRTQEHARSFDAAGMLRNLHWAALAWIACFELVWVVAEIARSL